MTNNPQGKAEGAESASQAEGTVWETVSRWHDFSRQLAVVKRGWSWEWKGKRQKDEAVGMMQGSNQEPLGSPCEQPGMVPRTRSTGITWELFGHADSQAFPCIS